MVGDETKVTLDKQHIDSVLSRRQGTGNNSLANIIEGRDSFVQNPLGAGKKDVRTFAGNDFFYY